MVSSASSLTACWLPCRWNMLLVVEVVEVASSGRRDEVVVVLLTVDDWEAATVPTVQVAPLEPTGAPQELRAISKSHNPVGATENQFLAAVT